MSYVCCQSVEFDLKLSVLLRPKSGMTLHIKPPPHFITAESAIKFCFEQFDLCEGSVECAVFCTLF